MLTIADDIRMLQVLQRVPTAIAQDARDRRDRADRTTRSCCSRAWASSSIFGLTLTLAMLLTLFSALALAFVLSERLSAPLSALAEATRAIAKGDYSKLNPVKSRDEFGVLTQSFNTMTRQIADATEVMERNQQQLENAKTYLESILSNLTSGVLTLRRAPVREDDERAPRTTSSRVPAGAFHGLKLSDWPRHVPGGGAVRRDRAAPVRLLGHAAMGRADGIPPQRRRRARCCCAARAWARAARAATWWCSTTSRT